MPRMPHAATRAASRRSGIRTFLTVATRAKEGVEELQTKHELSQAYSDLGRKTADLVDSQARLIHFSVTGRPGPSGVVGREPAVARPRPRTGPVPGGRVVSARRPAR